MEKHSKRSTILVILAVAGIGTGLWLYGLGNTNNVSATPPSAERRDPMYATPQNLVADKKTPAMDATAAVRTETATFALG